MKPERNEQGSYPAYAWPGGYPLFYLDKQNNCLCPECASREVDQSQEVIACDVHWEGDAITCDDCGRQIESAYGNPE